MFAITSGSGKYFSKVALFIHPAERIDCSAHPDKFNQTVTTGDGSGTKPGIHIPACLHNIQMSYAVY